MLKKLIHALTPEPIKAARAESRAWSVLAAVMAERQRENN